jgi:Spy/CpxP family protein refolding chaperone
MPDRSLAPLRRPGNSGGMVLFSLLLVFAACSPPPSPFEDRSAAPLDSADAPIARTPPTQPEEGRPVPLGIDRNPSFLEDGRLAEVADAIDLDPKIRNRIRAIAREASEENVARRAAIDQARKVLRSLLDREKPDPAAVDEQIDVLTDLQRGLIKRRVAAMIEIRGLLSPEQIFQLADLRRLEASPVAGACRDDVRRLCPQAPDVRQALRCLVQRREEVSGGCRERLLRGGLAHYFEADPGSGG